ncbi:MAG: NAD(P)H-dependent oxidoreductase [Lachnospiraceae bacterium]|nr:NAD(P)H-dependent oxidoreductase [Lachnospiraceae bacterium]
MVLFVNACVRTDSRTRMIAERVLEKLEDEIKEVRLSEVEFPKTDERFLKYRDECISSGNYGDPYFDYARQFAIADTIVIAAPYWDLSFPAVLKQYIEHINVLGITFEYTAEGFPKGLCRAKKLYYVMTAGGSYVPEEFGFGYIAALAHNFYGIDDVELIKATGLDIYGADTEAIIDECIAEVDCSVKTDRKL